MPGAWRSMWRVSWICMDIAYPFAVKIITTELFQFRAYGMPPMPVTNAVFPFLTCLVPASPNSWRTASTRFVPPPAKPTWPAEICPPPVFNGKWPIEVEIALSNEVATLPFLAKSKHFHLQHHGDDKIVVGMKGADFRSFHARLLEAFSPAGK